MAVYFKFQKKFKESITNRKMKFVEEEIQIIVDLVKNDLENIFEYNSNNLQNYLKQIYDIALSACCRCYI